MDELSGVIAARDHGKSALTLFAFFMFF